MIRKLLLSTALLTVAGTAFAADLPMRSAPAAYMAPVFTWTGFYVGVNAGYARSWNKTTDVDYYDYGGTKEFSKSGFTGGAQAGYNWQMGALVLGAETDINFLGNKSSEVGKYDSFRSDARYFGTVRARAGVAVDRALIYVTGGLAYGNTRNGWGYYRDNGGTYYSGWTDSFTSNKTRIGFAVGAGVEYALTQNWTVKVEGLYVDLGSNGATCSSTYCGTTNGTKLYRAKFDNSAAIVRAGVNYKY
jgi:outer membrane immunogenic protein